MSRKFDRCRFQEASGASAAILLGGAALGGCSDERVQPDTRADYASSELLRSFFDIVTRPVVEQQFLPDPVIIERSADHETNRVLLHRLNPARVNGSSRIRLPVAA